MDQKDEARRQFLELYRDTLKAGVLPPLDSNFRQVVTDNYRSSKEWVGLMRETADRLIKEGRRTGVFVLIEQCRAVNDQALADELLDRVTAGLEKGLERVAVRVMALEALVRSRQWDKAERLLTSLLAEKESAGLALPWRLGFEIATGRKDSAKAMERLERALDLEYANLPDEIDLASVRRDYGQLLALYGQKAGALAVLQQKPETDLIARIVKVSDRWRELESDPKIPCQEAGRILKLLGATDVAWEYLTTIPALQGGESGTWLELVQMQRQQGEIELSDRAYAAAANADPSNAQLLWDRATLLQEAGRLPKARDVLRRLAEGKWDAKFQSLQDQARGQLGGL
jgi:tetratricopeptide (TPR) repeat protein